MLVLGTIAAHTGSPRRPPRHHWLAPACQAQGIRTQRTGISAKGILGSRQAKGLSDRQGFWVRAHQSAEFEAPPGIVKRPERRTTPPRLLGTIHETLNSLSCTLSSRATSQQELVSPGALTSHAFTVECGCGLRAAPLHVPCPWAWLLSSSLSLSAHTHSFSARGCARGFPPQRAGQTCNHSPNPRAQGSLPGPAGVSRYRPASSCTYLTSFFSNSGQASNRSATRP